MVEELIAARRRHSFARSRQRSARFNASDMVQLPLCLLKVKQLGSGGPKAALQYLRSL